MNKSDFLQEFLFSAKEFLLRLTSYLRYRQQGWHFYNMSYFLACQDGNDWLTFSQLNTYLMNLRFRFMMRITLFSGLLFWLSACAVSQSQDHLLDASMSSHYANLDGFNMHYVKTGKGPELMIVVHGFPEFWYGNFNILKGFEDDQNYTVIAPDLRGYNLTDKPEGVSEYQVAKLLEDIRQLAFSLGHEQFVLCGHDWGGIVSWWLAITHPENVSKFIIINSPHPMVFLREMRNNPEQQAANSYTKIFRSPEGEEIMSANNFEKLVDMMMGEGLKTGVFTERDVEIYREAWSRPGALTGGLNWYRASSEYGTGLEVNDFTVKVPTLVMWGMLDDFILSSNLNGLDEFVPDLRVKEIPDGTHWVIHEQPEVVVGYMKEFLEEK